MKIRYENGREQGKRAVADGRRLVGWCCCQEWQWCKGGGGTTNAEERLGDSLRNATVALSVVASRFDEAQMGNRNDGLKRWEGVLGRRIWVKTDEKDRWQHFIGNYVSTECAKIWAWWDELCGLCVHTQWQGEQTEKKWNNAGRLVSNNTWQIKIELVHFSNHYWISVDFISIYYVFFLVFSRYEIVSSMLLWHGVLCSSHFANNKHVWGIIGWTVIKRNLRSEANGNEKDRKNTPFYDTCVGSI